MGNVAEKSPGAGVGEGFPEGLGEAVEFGCLLKASGFEVTAVEGGLFQEFGGVGLGHFCKWSEADAGASESLGETWSAEGGVDFGG